MEDIENTKAALHEISLFDRSIPEHYKEPGWGWNKIIRLGNLIALVYRNNKYINKPWFKEYHDFLFEELPRLISINKVAIMFYELKHGSIYSNEEKYSNHSFVDTCMIRPLEYMKSHLSEKQL